MFPSVVSANSFLLDPMAIYNIELLEKGGWTMYVLGALSIGAIWIFIERILTLRRATADPTKLLESVKSSVLQGDIQGAIDSCKKQNTPMSRMLLKGVSTIEAPLTTIEASVENLGKLEVYRLERNLANLATIAGVAPMIGFFGTVIGMIKTFMTIAQDEGEVTTKALSGGIYEAMVTTAGGLAVGIAAYMAYNYLVSQVNKVVHQMERTSIEFLDLLQRPN